MHALAAFLASFVECVEALTVVLAVGATRGWLPAFAGTGLALALLAALVLAGGPALTRLPLGPLHLVLGTLLLLFGLRWLRKAILRAARFIPLHDEAESYARHAARLGTGRVSPGWDGLAVATAFQITMIEGVEVVFIVIAMGAGGLLGQASLGAAAALLLVVLLGAALHRPLVAIPENTMKFTVGVLLSAFGTFWVGEGLRLTWPGGDWTLLCLVIVYMAAAGAAVALCRRPHPASAR